MTIAAPSTEQRFELYEIDWDFYESLLDRLQDRHVFVTYSDGTLELMSPSYKHDKCARLLCHLIWVMAEEFGLPLASGGSTTLRRKDKKTGLEPDECFYIQNEAAMRGKDKIDLTRDPPPDLVIEVEISRRLAGRKKLYARLSVPELWRYDGEHLRAYVLGEDREYRLVDRSPTFPQVSLEELGHFVEAGRKANQTEWIRTFRQWIKEQSPNR